MRYEKKSTCMNVVLDLYRSDLIAAKNITEFALLLTGRKRVMRLVARQPLLDRLEILADSAGLTIQRSPFALRTVFSTVTYDHFQTWSEFPPDADDEFVVFVGHGGAAREACELEASSYSDATAAALYGYPPCCARAYGRIAAREPWIKVHLEDATAVNYPYPGNKLASLVSPYLSLLSDYFPCSPGCAPSIELARLAEKALSEVDLSVLAEMTRRHLTALCLVVDDILWYVPEFIYDEARRTWTGIQRATPITLGNTSPIKCAPPRRVTIYGSRVEVECADSVRRFENGDSGNHFVVYS